MTTISPLYNRKLNIITVLIRTCSHREAWWSCWPPGGTACRQGGGEEQAGGAQGNQDPHPSVPRARDSSEPWGSKVPGEHRVVTDQSPELDITGVPKHGPFRHQLSTSHCKPCPPPQSGLACFSSLPHPHPPPLMHPTPISAVDATELRARRSTRGRWGKAGAQRSR